MTGTRFYCAHPECRGHAEGPFFGTVPCPRGGHNLVCGPQVTVDAIVEHRGRIVLVRRREGDVQGGVWALPGGFVDFRERLVDAVVREVAEETGLEAAQLRQFGVYDDPHRDMTDCRNNVAIVYTALGVGSLRLTPDGQGRYELAAVRGFTREEIRDREFRPCPRDAGLGAAPAAVAPGLGLRLGDLEAGPFEIGFDHGQVLDGYFRRVSGGSEP